MISLFYSTPNFLLNNRLQESVDECGLSDSADMAENTLENVSSFNLSSYNTAQCNMSVYFSEPEDDNVVSKPEDDNVV